MKHYWNEDRPRSLPLEEQLIRFLQCEEGLSLDNIAALDWAEQSLLCRAPAATHEGGIPLQGIRFEPLHKTEQPPGSASRNS